MARRRDAAATRAAILSSAETRLRADGPASLRLDDVARDVGVSRQAVLHHFGSRDALLRSVVERAWAGLFDNLGALAAGAGSLDPVAFLELVDDVARTKGNARLGAWLLLSQAGLPEGFFAGALEELPSSVESDTPDNAKYALLLVGAALFGDAIFGERLRQALGLPDGEEHREAFRHWMASLIGGQSA
ncbi:MAG: TetR/AcrR family transcriptional regulator [Deltaproteobacteria bacterium]|nr:TetR/AcrR family transcriptional regulator [Deltaproteobacteria bacterium]